LSDGRLTVGIGVGQREHDYRAIGADMRRRWARMDAQVATMRSIWAGEPPFPGADPVGPPPVQPGGPPLVAGVMGPKGLARAARWAAGVDDGASVFGVDAAVAGATFDRIRAAWRAAGRDDAPHVSTSLWFALGPGAEDRLRRYAYDYLRNIDDGVARALAARASCHTPGALATAVEALEALGCDELFLVPTTVDVAQVDRVRDALGC
jgi:alkanesulfonate monooxygenase SsuD/methylene tetrahydromethanopterin reductase-like flavin-dependent oxidoreductase (luciferase family)